jgi:hypothetical protein
MIYGSKFALVTTNSNEDNIGNKESCFIDNLTCFKEILKLVVEYCNHFGALL